MANADKAFGFLLLDTEGKEYRVRRYPKTAAEIFNGDAVMQDAEGAVKVATAAVAIVGVAAEYASASAETVAVIDDPDAVFAVQANGSVVAADLLQNADLVANAGDALLLRSTQELNTGSLGTGATLQLKILNKTTDVENEFGSFVKLVVKINNHVMKGGTGTAGI